jgi:hypothetical protein
LKQILRIVAACCLLGSAPLALVEFLWLPATVIEFVQLQHDPAPWGTPSYHAGREVRLNRVREALLLYALGAAALCGLCIVVANVLSWRGELAIWSITAVAGMGIAIPNGMYTAKIHCQGRPSRHCCYRRHSYSRFSISLEIDGDVNPLSTLYYGWWPRAPLSQRGHMIWSCMAFSRPVSLRSCSTWARDWRGPMRSSRSASA